MRLTMSRLMPDRLRGIINRAFDRVPSVLDERECSATIPASNDG